MITTQILEYKDHTEAIALLGAVIDMLGHKQMGPAIERLMAYRNHLLETQQPTLRQFNPREDRP